MENNICYQNAKEAVENFAQDKKEHYLNVIVQFPLSYRTRFYEILDRNDIFYTKQEWTDPVDGSKCLKFTLFKKTKLTSCNFLIQTFEKYFKVGLPIVDFEHFQYYLSLFAPYRSIEQQFSGFLDDWHAFNKNTNDLCSYVNGVLTKITNDLKEQLKPFYANAFEAEMEEVKAIKNKKQFYIQENVDQQYISIDIVKANFNVIRFFYPECFMNAKTWAEYVQHHDSKQLYTLQNSKFLREKLFGDLRTCKKTVVLSEYLLQRLVTKLEISKNEIVYQQGDEVIFKYSPLLETKLQGVDATMFRCETFTLQQLHSEYDYFVKSYSNGRTEFKCIPKSFICECIKFWEKKLVLPIDLEYMTENGRRGQYLDCLF